MIVNAVSGRDKLRVLHLEVDHLGPPLFDLFSTKLPSLHDLHLVFLWVSSAFDQMMAQQRESYSEWKLRHFIAHPYLRVKPDILAHWQDVVGTALPHLHTLRVADSS
jgi:hypothetical protein